MRGEQTDGSQKDDSCPRQDELDDVTLHHASQNGTQF